MGGQTDGWMDGRTDGRIDGWSDRGILKQNIDVIVADI